MENSNITNRSENIRGEAASADKGMAADGEATSVKASSIYVHGDTSAQPEPESLVSAGAAAPRGNQAVSRAAVLQPRDQAAVSQAAVSQTAVAQAAAPATNQQRAPEADGAAKSTALHGAMPLKAGGRIVLGNDRQKASPGAGRKGAAAVPPPQSQPSGVMPPVLRLAKSV